MPDKLEYLSVEDVNWSKGFERPRMTALERRVKHRHNQQQFMAREKRWMAGLQATEELLELHLRYLLASLAAWSLADENKKIERELLAATMELFRVPNATEDDDFRMMLDYCSPLFDDEVS